MQPNYYSDLNRFSLAGPPAWWLKKLWDFDNSLVVVPSRQACLYRLAQRRQLNLPESIVNEALFKESDTQMLATYGLIPVTTIVATANWSNPYIFVELANRAPWRQGGADAVNQRLEDEDLKDELDKRVKTDEHLASLSKDAWGLYNKKIGVRSHMYIPKSKQGSAIPQSKSPAIKIVRG
jgi:hypothetical protein